ncbi:MAG: OmpA family protein [Gammaproteobacteria bacterium]|nr:OmpA family protein [Gammaproteobacteria bacterium]
MQTYPLQLDALDVKKPGLWPWVVGIIALGTMVLCLSRDLGAIEQSLHSSAVATVSGANARGVVVEMDGRDMRLSGTLNSTVDRSALVGALEAIDGVRVINDEITVVDPVVQIKTQQVDFQKKLAAIDTASVAFQPSSASLSLSSESILLQTAKLLRAFPQRQIKIAGHTDNSGRAEANLELSRRRAQAVADFLTARGISPQQLIVQGYGHTRPLYDNNTEEGRSKNRRIEFIYMK